MQQQPTVPIILKILALLCIKNKNAENTCPKTTPCPKSPLLPYVANPRQLKKILETLDCAYSALAVL